MTTRLHSGGDRRHVWIVNQYALPSGSSGITRHGDLGQVLVDHGFSVTVFASSFDNFRRSGEVLTSYATNETDASGVRFIWLPTPAYVKNDGRRVQGMVGFYRQVLRHGTKAGLPRPQAVIGSSPHLLSAFAGSRLAKHYNAKFLLELRDVWPDDLVALGAIRGGGILDRALTWLARKVERDADTIITVPPKLDRFLLARGVPSDRILPLPNGLFVEDDPRRTGDESGDLPVDPSHNSMPESLARMFSSAEGSFKVVYLGAHGVANDLQNVLATAEYIRKNHADVAVSFVLVGGGQQREDLMMKAATMELDNVYFHPPVPKAAVPQVASAADALLVHLHSAGTFDLYGRSPNKLYDYLAAAKPVLYSTLDDESIIDRVGAGLTFTPGVPAHFAAAIVRLVAMPVTDRVAMGKRGREALIKDHDLADLGRRLAKRLTDLLEVDYRREEARRAE